MTTVNLKKGDRLPKLRARLTDSAGTALNLSGGSVVFRMRPRAGGALKVDDEVATVVDATAGTVEYAWGASDTDTAGMFDAEFAVTLSGLVETVPSSGYVLVVISDSLAA